MTMLLLAIIQTITGIIAVILAWLALRRSQPQQTPVANHPPSKIQRIGLRLGRAAPWVLVLSTLMSVWNLISTLRSPKPLDRWTVLIIAFSLSAIVFNLMFWIFMYALRGLYKEFVQQAQFNSLLDEFKSLLEIMKDLSHATKTGDLGILELIKNLAEPPSEPPKPPEQKPKA
jgi:hypothetical protein